MRNAATAALLALAACGGGSSGADAGLDGQPGCDYVQKDHTSLPDSEVVPIAYTGAPITICGSIDLLHGSGASADDATLQQFQVTASQPGEVLIRFDAAASLDGFASADVAVFGPGGAYVAGGHDVFVSRLAGGGQADQIVVHAKYPTTATAPIPYRLTIAPGTRASLCPAVAGPADYTEAHDGPQNVDNDVLQLGVGGTIITTPSATDTPEASGVTVGAGAPRRIHGTSADNAADGSGFRDRDTYELTTGPDVDEVAIREAWTGTPSLYFMLAQPDLKQFNINGQTGANPNVEIFPVKPSTTYWLWIASSTAGAGGLPVDYDVSLCGGKAP